MIQKETLAFMSSLAKNNNKTWFDANRDKYQAAKENYEEAVSAIISHLSAADDSYKELNAKDCIMRIFRDVRFSKDKTPYKTNLGAGISKGGRKFMGAGCYLHIEPGGKSFAGGGMWMPEAPMLKAVRQEIDYNLGEFKAITGNKQFKKLFPGGIEGEQLVKLPQGYSADNPAIELLKKKSFIVSHNFTDEEVTAKGFEKKVAEIFTAMQPFLGFLNRAVE